MTFYNIFCRVNTKIIINNKNITHFISQMKTKHKQLFKTYNKTKQVVEVQSKNLLIMACLLILVL